MRTRYLVCYDISDERRWRQVFRLLTGEGLHLQFSVFLCALTWPELQRLKHDLANRIDPREDDVRLYPLPSGESMICLGRETLVPDGATVVLP